MTGQGPSNVLFVVLDTVRKDHLTPYGYDRPTTPNLEAFADEATVFEEAVAPAPWTLPVHASMFTGLYPSQHGADQESPYLDDVATLASVLSARGYDTACYSSNAWITPYTKLTRGFEHHDTSFEIMPGNFLSGTLANLWQTINDNDRLRNLANRIVHLGAKAHAKLAGDDGAASKTPAVIDQTKAFIEQSDEDAGERTSPSPVLEDQDLRHDESAKRSRTTSQARQDPGWFAFVNLMDAHLPYHPPEEYREEFSPGVDPSEVCQNSKEFNSGARDIDDEEWESIRGLYDAEIAHIDAELGRLFDWLRETDRWEDTTVVVCADHGEHLGEHDLYGHEFALYDELINVPLMVKHPDLEADRREDLVELVDLYHTTLDAAGVDPAAAGGYEFDAVARDATRSLLSASYREFAAGADADPGQRAVVDGDDDADYAFVEYSRPVIELHHLEEKASAAGIDLPDDHRAYSRLRAARELDAKYVRADRIADEAYRLDSDPDELTPIDPDDDEVVAATERALSRFEQGVGGAWTDADGADAGSADALDDADEEMRERLRDLGYME